MVRKLSHLVLVFVMAVSCGLLTACGNNDGDEIPAPVVPLKNFNMYVGDETSAENFYALGIFAPQEWTQTEYEIDIEGTGADLLQYYESYSSSFTLNQPIIMLDGPNGEFAYGYADLGGANMPIATSAEDYAERLIRAHGFGAVSNERQIALDVFPYNTRKNGVLGGTAFDVERGDVKQRIVVLKMKSNIAGQDLPQDTAFGVFHIGCDTEDYDNNAALFDRMEKNIYGFGVANSDRELYDNPGSAMTDLEILYYNPGTGESAVGDYYALGLQMPLPTIFDGFIQSGNYANSFATLYDHWGNTENQVMDSHIAGTVKCEIYRDPVRFSDVFDPIYDLYSLHADHTSDYNPEPVRLTTVGGVPAVYSIHNSFKGLYIYSIPDIPNYEYLAASEVKRDIVYTFISGDWIYTVSFQMTYNFDFNVLAGGESRHRELSSVMYHRLDKYEEYYVFAAMDNAEI